MTDPFIYGGDDEQAGRLVRAVRKDLDKLPEPMREGGIAATALMLARQLDDYGGDMSARDVAGHARELRIALETLREQAPGDVKGDSTDEVRERRERRMRTAGE